MAVSVGDIVWFDVNRNGIRDAADVPIPQVVLTITSADGREVRDVLGNPVTTVVTDDQGRYSFDNLPPGKYKVSVSAPRGFVPTKAGVGSSATDSSSFFALSVNLTEDGQRDPTLDFGFFTKSRSMAMQMIPHVAVGDQIWIDQNGDGVQESDARGLEGATVSIRYPNGRRVVDVMGRPVRPQVTEKDGRYRFDGLPPGRRYVVSVKYPKNFRPTTPGRRGRFVNSSTDRVKSRLLQAGEVDLSLDFGVVSKRREELPQTR